MPYPILDWAIRTGIGVTMINLFKSDTAGDFEPRITGVTWLVIPVYIIKKRKQLRICGLLKTENPVLTERTFPLSDRLKFESAALG